MKRVLTATCLAATFAVGLGAQSTGTSGTATATTQEAQPGRGGGPRTVTGCLRAGDTAGSYMLTDVVMQGGGGRRGGDAASTGASTTAGTATTGGTTTGSATTGSTTAGPEGGRAQAPTSIMLNAATDVDLKPHVGHKIEVTGTMAGGRGRSGDAAGSATGTATATGGTTAGGATTAAGSATGTGTGTSATGGQATGRGGPRSMTVTSIRMISESCS